MQATSYHFAVGRLDDANALVMAHHYSKRRPAIPQVVGTWHEDGGLFGDRGEAVAACIFGVSAAKRREHVLELIRLVRRPEVTAPLSRLVSLTVEEIKARRLADLLVSFADKRQGHHGGIYQASGWHYAGLREPSTEGLVFDGRFIPDRSANNIWGTRSPEKIELITGRRPQIVMDEGKHLYWRAMNRHGRAKAARLGLTALPYPKPAIRREDDHATSVDEAGATPADRSKFEVAA